MKLDDVDEHDGFRVGDIVWQQMYDPQWPRHDSSIEERIAGRIFYGPRRLMRLKGITPDYRGPGVTRWWLVNPERPNDDSKMSWVESDWCVLEHAAADVGMLF